MAEKKLLARRELRSSSDAKEYNGDGNGDWTYLWLLLVIKSPQCVEIKKPRIAAVDFVC